MDINEAIEELKNVGDFLNYNLGSESYEVRCKIYDIRTLLIEQVKNYVVLGDVIKWVAVKDELPTVELDVLVWDGFSVYISNRLYENNVVWDESIQILDNVTHWHHLPKPPYA
jgi:hypothetical protein